LTELLKFNFSSILWLLPTYWLTFDNEIQVKYAFDDVSEKNSYQNLSEVLAKQGSKITLVLPGREYKEIPDYIQKSTTTVGSVHAPILSDSTKGKAGIKTGGKEFGFVFFRLFARGLEEGWFTAHPHEIVPGGLNGVEKGLQKLKNGANSATKYVFKIEDTKESNKI
jgi:NADPH2:quinone reductase